MLTPDLTPSQSITSSPSLPPTPDTRTLDLVIAHFDESLDWLASYSTLASVYSKGQHTADPSLYREAKILPNWGRESHTYLHHIVHNYDTLADVTLFLQGNIHDINDGTPAHTDLTLDEIVAMAKRLTDLPLTHQYREHEGRKRNRKTASSLSARSTPSPIGMGSSTKSPGRNDVARVSTSQSTRLSSSTTI